MAMFGGDVAAKLDMPLDAIIQQREAGEAMEMEAGGGAEVMDAEEAGNRRVYVGNLSFSTTWQELKDHMRQAGDVTHAAVLQSSDGRSKGCGLVEFATADAAKDAITTLYDSQLNGRAIFVREDRERGGTHGKGGHRGGHGGPRPPAPMVNMTGAGMPVAHAFPGRRVYVGNLAWGVAWQDLKDHMRQVGEVMHADILTGPDGRSKGCGLVEFSSEQEAQAAISQLSDTVLKGRTIFVREDREGGSAPRGPTPAMPMAYGTQAMGPGAEQGLGTFATQASSQMPVPGTQFGGTRVFVGNLSWDVTWQDLKDCMRHVGNVVRADVMVSNGKSKGCGIVEFETPQEAQQAMVAMADFNLKGRPIFVREDREAASGSGYGNGGGYPQGGYSAAGGYAQHGPAQQVPQHSAPPANYHEGGGMDYAMEESGASDRAGRQLYVGNLSWGTSWQSLKDHFRSAGEVEYVELAMEPRGRSKGFGTVRFPTVEEAATAIATLNNSELDGRQITVRIDSYA